MIICLLVLVAIILIGMKIGFEFSQMDDPNIGLVQQLMMMNVAMVIWVAFIYIPITQVMSIFYPGW